MKRSPRACKRSPAKVRVFEEECTRPFGVVHTDMKGPLLESHCGLRYSIVFIDHVTRMACTYYMSRKSEAPDKLRRYLSWVKKLGWCVGLIRADRGSEYFGQDGEYVQKIRIRCSPSLSKSQSSMEWQWRPHLALGLQGMGWLSVITESSSKWLLLSFVGVECLRYSGLRRTSMPSSFIIV